MEKKEILKWREHLIKMFGVYHSDEMRHTDCPLCGVNLEKISDFMIEELDKAREEGKNIGWKDCEKFYKDLRSILRPYHQESEDYRTTLKRLLSKLKTKEDGK